MREGFDQFVTVRNSKRAIYFFSVKAFDFVTSLEGNSFLQLYVVGGLVAKLLKMALAPKTLFSRWLSL